MELRDIKGLGPKRLAALRSEGITSPRELLWRLPASYRDTSISHPIAQIRPGESVCVEVRIEEKPRAQYIRGLSIVRALAGDEEGQIRLIWFNQPWSAKLYRPGDTALLYGRVERFKGELTLRNPQRVSQRGIEPIYSPLGDIAGKTLSAFLRQLLPELPKLCPETMPEGIRRRYQLCDLAFALHQAHQPTDQGSLAIAKRRIGFENLLLYQLALRSLQGEAQQGIRVLAPPGLLDRFWQGTGFMPTGAQRRVMQEVCHDLESGLAMRRLVQGDVGSGKTAIAFAAAALMQHAGYQTALMVPTEILARQHLESAQKLLAPLGLGCGLLLGGMKAAQRREALEQIASGAWHLVIGTHALFSQDVRYADLGLVITDEQHRFGVRQRQRLSLKAAGDQPPHVMVMSATPIPRTLALILYGDLEVSIIDEMPPGRLPVKTRIVPDDKRAEMYDFIRRKAAAGEQSYLVCPLVEESEQIEAKDAHAMYEELRQGPLHELRLGLTFGSQPQEEKEAAIAGFSRGETDVLVATTVIEVGVNVPRATVMVIENADRFGLSQLHQLRGRVGRAAKESWCFLMGEPNERLRTLCATHDGFLIAQKDLELRGPGDFLGTRQHGRVLPDAYGVSDIKLIEETRAAVHALSHEPALAGEAQGLMARAHEKYGKALCEIALH
ncbi:MAG: ATP-dependent DNA helicase RecG [Christensenellales bacterium]